MILLFQNLDLHYTEAKDAPSDVFRPVNSQQIEMVNCKDLLLKRNDYFVHIMYATKSTVGELRRARIVLNNCWPDAWLLPILQSADNTMMVYDHGIHTGRYDKKTQVSNHEVL